MAQSKKKEMKSVGSMSGMSKLIIGSVFGVIGAVAIALIILFALGLLGGETSGEGGGGGTPIDPSNPPTVPPENPFCCKGYNKDTSDAEYWWDCGATCHSNENATLITTESTDLCTQREAFTQQELPRFCQDYIIVPPETEPYIEVRGVAEAFPDFAYLDGIYEICTFDKCPELMDPSTNCEEGYNDWLVHLNGNPNIYGNVYKQMDPGYSYQGYLSRFQRWYFVWEDFCSAEITCNDGNMTDDGFVRVDGDNCPTCSYTLNNGAINGIILGP